MGPDLYELFEDGKEDDEIAAIIRLGHFAVLPQGVRVVSQFSEIITVRLKRGNIPKVSGAPEVASMIAGDTYLGPDLEEETAGLAELSAETLLPSDERRPKDEKAEGQGVVVGVVDWGFDFAHPDFRKPDGTSRILALWDQRGGKLPDSPQPFGYGRLHDREAINRALKAKEPYVALNYHPADADTGKGCHGTHVAGIAAGSGSQDRPAGIAPQADLVLVHNAPLDEEGPARLGDSVTLLEAIDFIARTAGDRPWVINLSMGRHGEPHDGSTLVEQGLDGAVRESPGRAICMSAGNYFDKRIHAAGQLRPSQERTFVWEINEGDPSDNELEIWYSWQDKFEVAIRSPDQSLAARMKVGERAKLLVGGKEVGNVYHRGQEPNNLDNHIHIFLYKGAPAGAWEVTLIGVDVIDGRFHAWIERDVACARCQSHFRAEDADPRSTTGTICNGRRTIAVGAYNNHHPEMRMAHFSSAGPTRDGRLKPDLSAPGVSVLAARSAPRNAPAGAPLMVRMSGTSMGAPHVTGTVALMFQVAPRRLRIEETHNLLLESALRVSIPEEVPDRIGIGYLDIEEAVEAARTLGGISPILKQVSAQKPATMKPETEVLATESSEQHFVEGKAEIEQSGDAAYKGNGAPFETDLIEEISASSSGRLADPGLLALLSSPDCQKLLKSTKVAVVGGGFGGLMAARVLSQHGVTVKVFEARPQVGGRVLSNTAFSKGRITEFGAELIGSFHSLWLNLALEYGLAMISRMDEDLYELEGLAVRVMLDDKPLSVKELQDSEKEMRKVLTKIAEIASQVNHPSQPWKDPTLQTYDKISVADFLRGSPFHLKPSDPLWKQLQFRLVNDEVAPLDEMNFLGLLCKVKAGQGERLGPKGKDPNPMGYWDELEIFRCADGCQKLALKIAETVKSKNIVTRIAVTNIDIINTPKPGISPGVLVTTRKVVNDDTGDLDSEPLLPLPFDYVIFAIPPSVWGRVTITVDGKKVDPGHDVGVMGMNGAVKFFSEVKTRFWILQKPPAAPYGGALALGQVWEGTDNQTQVDNQNIVLSVFAGPIFPPRRVPTEKEITDGLTRLYPEYPKNKPKTHYSNWPIVPFIKTGYASPRIGEIFSIAKALNEPYRDRLFFAGEHTRMDFFGYMEGALRSGEDAASLVMMQACGQLKKPAPAPSKPPLVAQNTYHRVANDITSAFEGGKPGTLNLYDRGIISYGKHQATLASGTLYPILKRYTELSTSQTAANMSGYLDRVQGRDQSLREDVAFIRLLQEAAKEPEMNRAQDEEFSRQYWEPAKRAATGVNIKSALGYALLYDTRIQGGMDEVLKATKTRLGGKVGDSVAGKEITEQEFLRGFVDERIKRNLRISENQKKEADALNKEAQSLEEAAAADSGRAAELRRQATEKRQKAKQTAANAAALDISATKTRGPSLMALVDSGDLNLYGDATGKVYLKGKVGVVIAGLKPGAAVDATTPAEAELTLPTPSDTREILESQIGEMNVIESTNAITVSETAEVQESESEVAEIVEANLVTMEANTTGNSNRFSEAATGLDTEGVEVVERIDQIVTEGVSDPTTMPLLLALLMSRSTGSGKASPSPQPADLFDGFAYPGCEALRQQLEQDFEVIALPRSPLERELRPADVLVRRGDGEMAHVSMIASPELRNLESLVSEGITPETFAAGQYAQVVEIGARPHGLGDGFARRVVDANGKMPYDQLVLRPRDSAKYGVLESRLLGESITSPGLIESFNGRVYTSGWTTFTPFQLNGKPHYLAYKALTGDVSIDRFRPGLHEDPATHWPVDVVYSATWTLGWSTIFAFMMDGQPHYFAYKKDSGRVAIGRFDASGSTITEHTLFDAAVFSTGWTHFMPFELNGRPHYLAYKAAPDSDGKCQVAFDRIRPGAKPNASGWPVDTLSGTVLDATEKWTPGWTHFMPFKLPGRSEVHYLSYKALTGDVDIDRINPDGKGFKTIWGTFIDPSIIWSHGANAWTHFMPFTIDGFPHYLSYKATTGEVDIDRFKPDGMGSDTIWGTALDSRFKWWPGWTTIMPFRMDAKSHYFAYNAANGWVAAASMAEELRRCVSPGVSSIDPTASSIASVGTDDFNVSVSVRGTTRKIRANIFYPAVSDGSRKPFHTTAVAGGRAPIVFIAHGNHSIFFDPANRLDERGTNPGGFSDLPNHRGYIYFQEILARMGIMSVSVDCNEFSGFIGLTVQNINDRADLVLGAIKHMQSLNSGSDPIFGNHVDFSNVGLMGHSRGGEVVVLVPELLAQAATGIAGVGVKGVMAVAPTAVGATSGIPTGYAFMTILPAADLDVISNDGAKFYDQASADPFKCQLYLHYANHNYFNTEWVSDDRGRWNATAGSLTVPRANITVMTKDEQKAILKAYGSAFFRTVLLGHSLRQFMENLEIPVGVARFPDIHISFERLGSTTVEDNEGPDINVNTLGKPNKQLSGLTAKKCAFIKGSASACNDTFYGNTRGMFAQTNTANGGFQWELAGPMDLSGREIRIRAAEVYNGSIVPAVATGFKIGLKDNKGKETFVDSDDVTGLPRPFDRRADDMTIFGDDLTKTMLTTFRFPTTCISQAKKGFDITKVIAICLRLDRNDKRPLAFDQLQIVF